MAKLFRVEEPLSSVETSINTVSERMGWVSKMKHGTNYQDGFKMQVVVNNGDFEICIEDKSVFDMFVALMFKVDMNLSEDTMSEIANYLSTVVYQMVKEQLVIKHNVSIRKLKFKFVMRRNPQFTSQHSLNMAFNEAMDKGFLLPVSPLHIMYRLNKNVFSSRWMETAFWTTLCNPNANETAHDFLPLSVNDYKNKLQGLLKSESKGLSRLTTDFYVSELSFGFEKFEPQSYSLNDVYVELLVRFMLYNDIPDTFKAYTKGKWQGTNSNTLILDVPRYHRIAKFGVESEIDYANELAYGMLYLNDNSSAPYYCKQTMRLSEKAPVMTHRLLPNLDDF